MENNKIRVAITPGDINGVGYELIFKAFAEPDMLELCVPVVYGSQKAATFHAKNLELQTNFFNIKSARDARPGKLNLLTCSNEDVRVELGSPTKESAAAALKSLEMAMADCRERLVDVVVAGPMANLPADMGNAVYYNGVQRAVALSGKDNITAEEIHVRCKELFAALKRDCNVSNPRIAVLAVNPDAEGKEETEVIAPVVKQLREDGVEVFGPYQVEAFYDNRYDVEFSAVMASDDEQVVQTGSMLTDNEYIVSYPASQQVCVALTTDAFALAGKNSSEPDALRSAIYEAVDTFRHRMSYDEAVSNPLQKLYHERPDSGEKLRFSIPKKKEE